MTLRELMECRPEMFYPQTWYQHEPFLDTERRSYTLTFPTHILPETPTETTVKLPSVAQLALLYIGNPTHEIWSRYLWCSDLDSHGQRLYVGSNGQGLEIHRHLHLTSRWGVPSWT